MSRFVAFLLDNFTFQFLDSQPFACVRGIALPNLSVDRDVVDPLRFTTPIRGRSHAATLAFKCAISCVPMNSV